MNNRTNIRKSTTQVGHVQRALIKEFGDLIDMSDVKTKNQDEVRQRLLSRSLAALAVRRLTECDSTTAAQAVIDGRDDQGIDAIAFAEGDSEIFLVQAKWSRRGTAGIDMGAARALVDGFRKLDDHRFDRFNERLQPLVTKINALLSRPQVRVTLVLAVMGDGSMSPECEGVFEDAGAEFNVYGRRLQHCVIDGTAFWRFIRDGLVRPPIDLIVKMSQWLHRHGPVEAYYGTVSVEMVAQWYEEFGDRIFERNVRRSLGLTEVNQGMVDTLISSPETFWSRNNGITMLCVRVEPEFWGSRRGSDPVSLSLQAASVVNGAQTVSAIHVAWSKRPEDVQLADVSVRVICVPEGTTGLGDEITRSTNTQNHMEPRDFIALDGSQSVIRDDFVLALGKTYVFKRGEQDPAPDEGCSVVHAALALACAHHNPELAVRAKQNLDLLWEQGDRGAYFQLFGNQPSATQIWRWVLLFRKVHSILRELGRSLEGRPAAVLEHGDLVVTHLVFQLLGVEDIDDMEQDWEEVLGRVDGITDRMFRWLAYRVDEMFGTTSFVSRTFADPVRCRALVADILSLVRSDSSLPDVPLMSNPTVTAPPRLRSTRAVHVLLDAGHIAPGATLTYIPSNSREMEAMKSWLAGDDKRRTATWVPERTKPLLWAADGARYSPTGLVRHMWQLAGWEDSPVAIQGPKCWHLGSDGSLVEIADKLRRAMDSGDE